MDTHKIIGIEPRPVQLKDIDVLPGPYCMSFGFELFHLVRSIKKVGLANSPLLIEDTKGRITVIAGYRRIHALKFLRWDKVPCRVVSEFELSPFECLLLNFHDNLSFRGFNDVEKGMVLNRLSSHISKTEIMEEYMPLLDLPSHENTLFLYKRLEHELDTEIKEYLARGHLSFHAAKMILDMDENTRQGVFNIVSNIKFNINQQKQLIDYIVDILHINNITISEFMGDPAIRNVFADDRLNRPQKARALLRVLRNKRFPLLVEAEESFKKTVSGLDLPEVVRIDFPPFFEAPHYRLEVRFKQGEELKEILSSISSANGLNELGDPWGKGT